MRTACRSRHFPAGRASCPGRFPPEDLERAEVDALDDQVVPDDDPTQVGESMPFVAVFSRRHCNLSTLPNLDSVAQPCRPVGDCPMATMLRRGGHCPGYRFRPSTGYRHRLSPAESDFVMAYVLRLVEAGTVSPAKRGPYLSHPFLVPKAVGPPRLIIDYSHITQSLRVPRLHLPLFSNVLRSVAFPRGLAAIRFDLKHAFYSVPLHPWARFIITFLAGNRRFVFNRLPMGLATSPAALQHLLQEALAPLRSSVYVSWVHVDDLLFVDSPERLCVIASLVSALLAQWNFVVTTAKSQLTPCTVVNYLGLTLDFDSRSYKPLDAHVRAFFRIASSVSDSSPWARKEVYFGHAAFILASTLRLYPFFPYSVTRLTRFLHIVRAHTNFIMPMRVPPPRPSIVASDATPSCIAFTHVFTGFTFAAPRHAFQTHNELVALLHAVLYFRRSAVNFTDSTAVLSLCKSSL